MKTTTIVNAISRHLNIKNSVISLIRYWSTIIDEKKNYFKDKDMKVVSVAYIFI